MKHPRTAPLGVLLWVLLVGAGPALPGVSQDRSGATLLQHFERTAEEYWIDELSSLASSELEQLCSQATSIAEHSSADKALSLLKLALLAAQEHGNAEAGCRCALNLANRQFQAGHLRAARDVLEITLDDLGEAVPSEPWLLLLLSKVARRQGARAEALDGLDKVESALGDSGSQPLLEFHLTCERAETLLQLGVLDQSERLLLRARQQQESMVATAALPADTWLTLRVFELNYLLAIDDFDACLQLADRSLQKSLYLDAIGRKKWLLEYRRATALAQQSVLQPARLADAVAALQGVVESNALPLPDQPRAHIELARAFGRQGNFSAAGEQMQSAAQLLQELEKLHTGPLPATQMAPYWSTQTYLALAEGRPAAELQTLLLSVEEAYRSFLVEWDQAPLRSGGIGFLHFGSRRDILSELIRLQLQVDSTGTGLTRALELLLAARTRGSLARALGATEPRLKELRSELLQGAQHALAVYLMARDRTHLFVVEQKHLRHFECAPLRQLRQRRERLLPLVTRRPSPGEREELDVLVKDLSSALFPVALLGSLQNWQALTVCGIDDAGWMPLACLRPAPGLPLGQRLDLDVGPSVAVSLALLRRAAPPQVDPDRPLLQLIAAPRPAAETAERWQLVELPWDDAQKDLLTAAYPATSVLLHEADAAQLLRALDPQATHILQFVAHGVHAAERENTAGLALSPDAQHPTGVLWSEEVLALRRCPPLVVLAACGAGRGPLRRGDDGIHHLGGAFLRAGASAVILSFADLEYHSTLKLLASLHRNLAAGCSPARALRRARQEMASQPRTDWPYLHSLVQIRGPAQRSLFPVPLAAEATEVAPMLLWTVPSLLAAAATLLWVRGRRRSHGNSAEGR